MNFRFLFAFWSRWISLYIHINLHIYTFGIIHSSCKRKNFARLFPVNYRIVTRWCLHSRIIRRLNSQEIATKGSKILIKLGSCKLNDETVISELGNARLSAKEASVLLGTRTIKAISRISSLVIRWWKFFG